MTGALAAALVLLVTDDPTMAVAVRRALLDAGQGEVEVVAVDGVDEGLAAHEWRAFDVVLLHVTDPVRVDDVRRFAELAEPPVVLVLTDEEDDAASLALLRAGAEDVLARARLNARALGRVVRFAAERRGARVALRREVERLRGERQELERFTDEAIHDLKQPLATIRGMAGALEMRLRDRLDDEDHLLLARLQAGVGRVVLIVDDLLDHTRAPASPVAREEVDLDAVVADVLDVHATPLEEAGFRIEVDELPRVWSSRALLSRILDNVVANAARYAGTEPAPVLRIGAEPDGDGLVLSVEDNGPGVPVGQREEVLRWGVRGVTEGAPPGEGLGLAASRAAAHRLGGRLWIEGSSLGGAAVRIALPVRVRAMLHGTRGGGPASR